MTSRLITYTLGFFFLFSSLGYACPDLNNLSKLQHDSSFDEMASGENPCQDSDHDVNPLCQYILNNRIGYTSAGYSLEKVVSRVVFYSIESKSGFDASPTVFCTIIAPEFHSKPPLNLLYRILRV